MRTFYKDSLQQKELAAFHESLYNMCLYKAGLAIGSSSAKKVKVATGATGAFMINGVMFTSPASQEIAFTATTDDITANASTIQERIYLVCLNASGTGSLVAGEQADVDEAVAPDSPSDKCVIGKVKIQVAAGSTDFDASSDDLSAAHLTDVYTDMGIIKY